MYLKPGPFTGSCSTHVWLCCHALHLSSIFNDFFPISDGFACLFWKNMLNFVHFGPSAAWPLKLVDFEKFGWHVFCRIQSACWCVILPIELKHSIDLSKSLGMDVYSVILSVSQMLFNFSWWVPLINCPWAILDSGEFLHWCIFNLSFYPCQQHQGANQ